MRLLIATSNPAKVREFREVLGSDRFQWVRPPADKPAPAETGTTFRANACLKAAYYAATAECWAVADDSGLEVDALGGMPGIYSARWAQMHQAGAGDDANNRLLLRQLADVPDDKRRAARFVCVLALADPRGRVVITAADAVAGRIIHEPRGTNGFGYDPLFYVEPLGRTTAELAPQHKHVISHRGKALRRLRALMDRVGIG